MRRIHYLPLPNILYTHRVCIVLRLKDDKINKISEVIKLSTESAFILTPLN